MELDTSVELEVAHGRQERMDRGTAGVTRHGARRIRPILWREPRGEGAQREASGQVHSSHPLAQERAMRGAGAGASVPLRNSERPEGIIIVKRYVSFHLP